MARRPTSRVNKPGSGGRAGGNPPRSRRAVPAPQGKSPLPLILGVAGGAFVLLIIIIVVATSGGGSAPVRKQSTKAPVKVSHSMQKENTGWIQFICSNSGKHEDQEVFLKICRQCSQNSTFFWDKTHKGFVCFKCSHLYDNDLVKCPDCGRPPTANVRIKPVR